MDHRSSAREILSAIGGKEKSGQCRTLWHKIKTYNRRQLKDTKGYPGEH